MEYSILYPNEIETINKKEPICFKDLNLDQIFSNICLLDSEKEIIPYFYTPTRNIDIIMYRQDIFKDLENRDNYYRLVSFFYSISQTYFDYKKIVFESNYSYCDKRVHLELVSKYVNEIKKCHEYLSNADITSKGLIGLKVYLDNYIKTNKFMELENALIDIQKVIESIKYSMVIKGNEIYITKYDNDKEWNCDIKKTFDVFTWDEPKNFSRKVDDVSCSRDIDEMILTGLAKIFVDEYKMFDEFSNKYKKFFDVSFNKISIESRFYFSYITFMEKIRKEGLQFCYPNITNKEEEIVDSFDLALANKNYIRKEETITNGYKLTKGKRIIIVSGPNQGGKTTFARQFGQLHYLAGLGLPIPGSSANIFVPDKIFTHFKAEESLENLNGKLQIELNGIKKIIDDSTTNSIVILNEIFASTSSKDGYLLGEKLIDILNKKEIICLYVTFLDKLSTYSDSTISMVSTIVPEKPEIRTFKILQKDSDGLAYAWAISNKHHLTYEDVRRRINK